MPPFEPLTAQLLRNADYGSCGGKLVDGVRRLTPVSEKDGTPIALPPSEDPDRWATALEEMAFGDLNGDGAVDAAVVLQSGAGGTGTFEDLVIVFNQGGHPNAVACAHLGDRVVINAIGIQAGEVWLDMITHPPPASEAWQGQCCPTVPTVLKYRLQGDQLVETERRFCSWPEGASLRDAVCPR